MGTQQTQVISIRGSEETTGYKSTSKPATSQNPGQGNGPCTCSWMGQRRGGSHAAAGASGTSWSGTAREKGRGRGRTVRGHPQQHCPREIGRQKNGRNIHPHEGKVEFTNLHVTLGEWLLRNDGHLGWLTLDGYCAATTQTRHTQQVHDDTKRGRARRGLDGGLSIEWERREATRQLGALLTCGAQAADLPADLDAVTQVLLLHQSCRAKHRGTCVKPQKNGNLCCCMFRQRATVHRGTNSQPYTLHAHIHIHIQCTPHTACTGQQHTTTASSLTHQRRGVEDTVRHGRAAVQHDADGGLLGPLLLPQASTITSQATEFKRNARGEATAHCCADQGETNNREQDRPHETQDYRHDCAAVDHEAHAQKENKCGQMWT
jgi:hypothetical protein